MPQALFLETNIEHTKTGSYINKTNILIAISSPCFEIVLFGLTNLGLEKVILENILM